MEATCRTRRDDSSTPAPARRYEAPSLEWIPLDCEITAYAPDGDQPLF
jgi:hypothetical protein